MPLQQSQLAEHVVEYFSEDARYWPIKRVGSAPFSVLFLLEDEQREYVESMKKAWSLLLSPQYVAESGGEPLTLAHTYESCEGAITFREARHPETGDAGLSYELRFARSPEVYSGWFRFDVET